MRYDLIKQEQTDGKSGSASSQNTTDAADLQEEIAAFGDGPPEDLQRGSAERIQWFNAWIEEHRNDDQQSPLDSYTALASRMQMDPMNLLELARSRGLVAEDDQRGGRMVTIGPVDQVRPAIEEHGGLPKWGPQIEQFCGKRGLLRREDPSDSTAEVMFEEQRMSVWFPLSTLTDVMLEVCSSREQLRTAVEARESLKWNERLADTCGKRAILLRVDSDGTSNLRFPGLNEMEVWLPSDCLAEPAEAADEAGESAEGSA